MHPPAARPSITSPVPQEKLAPRLLLAAVLVAAAATLPALVPIYYVQFATKVLLVGALAVALNLVVGFGGLVSLCHAAFYGLAGYVLALAAPEYEAASVWTTLPLAVGASALAALVIGALSLRTRGIYFIMVTLAFGEMLFYLFHDTRFAGGSDGAYIYVKPEAVVFGRALFDLDRPAHFFWVALGVAVFAVAAVAAIERSPFGRALGAARDNERRALSLGFPVYRVRLVAFVLSGALAGLAGYFSAARFGFVAPQMLGWHLSATILVMVVLGGMRTVTGPLLGAAALMGLEEVLPLVTEHSRLALGLVVIAMVILLPNGARDLFTRLRAAPPKPAPQEKPAPPRQGVRDHAAG